MEVVEEDVPLSVEGQQQQLDFELAVFRALPGVTSVADFPAGGVAFVKPKKLNDTGIRLRLDGNLIKQTFNMNISDKVTAARVLKQRLKGKDFLGEAAVLAAEERVLHATKAAPQSSAEAAAQLPSEAEIEWLATWYDEQPEPDQVSDVRRCCTRPRRSSGQQRWRLRLSSSL